MDKSKPVDELTHYGVMGMKWGQTRTKATSAGVVQARRHLANKQNDIFTAHEKARATTKRGTAERKAADKRVDALVEKFNKDPARVLASRMTKGEKAVALLAGPLALIPIGASSLISRRIEYKQDKGAYNKK